MKGKFAYLSITFVGSANVATGDLSTYWLYTGEGVTFIGVSFKFFI